MPEMRRIIHSVHHEITIIISVFHVRSFAKIVMDKEGTLKKYPKHLIRGKLQAIKENAHIISMDNLRIKIDLDYQVHVKIITK